VLVVTQPPDDGERALEGDVAPGLDAGTGLRSRKKQRTRLAIADAALELFVEKGYEATTVEEIAERAEVSKATFFRYFAAKSEVIFHWNAEHHAALHAAIVGRPAEESDLTALRRGIVDWVATVDTERMILQGRAANTSPLLRGMSYDLGAGWQDVLSRALAERRGLDAPDQRHRLLAGVAFAAVSSGFNAWIADGASGAYPDAIDHAFDLLEGVLDAGL
jgi:AcrR family transcriptional regulator